MTPSDVPDQANRAAMDVYGASLRVGIAGDETTGLYSVVEGRFLSGGFAPIPHVHRNESESFYVVEGDAEFTVGDERTFGGAGSFLHVPAGTLHGFRNAGNAPLIMLFIHAPALDSFFMELADMAESQSLDPTLLRLLMNKWGMDTAAEE